MPDTSLLLDSFFQLMEVTSPKLFNGVLYIVE
jgi:hypothetical protein